MRDLLNLCLANAVVVTLIAIPAYCVSRWAKRPALAHVLWLFVLIKLVTPPLWHVPLGLPVSQSASLNKPADLETPRVESAPIAQGATTQPAIEVPSLFEQPINDATVLEGTVAVPAPVSVASDPTPLPAAITELPFEIPWQNIVGFWWLAGSSVVFSLTLWRLTAFVRCLHRVQPALPSVQALSEELSLHLGLKFAPRVGIAPIRMAPLVWGLGSRSRVIIPADLWETLDPEQRAMLLVHELAHLRRGDHWVRWLEIVVRGIYWWHPVVWLAGREMREAEEQCCDAWAVWALPHAAKAYARALVDTVDFLSQRSVPLPVGASGIGQFQDLRRRLIMIMRGTTPRKLSASTLAGLVVLGGALVVLGPSFGQQRQSEDVLSIEDPFQQPVPAAPRPPRLATVESDDPTKAAAITHLRRQEADLQQAMEALARSLEQTKRELKAVQGDRSQADDVVPAPRVSRDTVRGRSTTPRPTQPRPPVAVQRDQPPADNYVPTPRVTRDPVRPRNAAPGTTPPLPTTNEFQRSDDQPRLRISRERPLEERLSRLEEQMSQIANDLHGLKSIIPVPPHDAHSQPAPAALPRTRPQPSANPFPRPGVPPPVRNVPPDAADPAVPPSEAPAVPAPPAPVRPRRNSGDTTAPPALVPQPGTPAVPSAIPPLPATTPVKPDADALDPRLEVPEVPAPPAPVRPRRPSSDTIAPPALIPQPGSPADPFDVAPLPSRAPAKP